MPENTKLLPFKISLFPDWNLISFPGTPANPAVDNVLPATLAASVVLGHQGGEWVTAIRNGSGQWQGSLTEISGGYGYWIQTDVEESIEVGIPKAGRRAPVPCVPVIAGWNLLGVLDNQPDSPRKLRVTPADHYFSDLSWEVAYSFDTKANAWKRIVRGDESNVIAVGKGYWVWVESPGSLSSREATAADNAPREAVR